LGAGITAEDTDDGDWCATNGEKGASDWKAD